MSGQQGTKRIILVILTVYTALMVYWMFFGFGREVHTIYRYNFLPLRTIMAFMRGDGPTTWDIAVNICGNIGVFVPYGLLFASYYGCELRKSLPVFLTGLLTAEVLQLATKKGVFDVDDILLNTAGFFVGHVIYSVYRKSGDQRHIK